MRKLRLGLVGCGDMGKVHIKDLLTIDEAEVVAIADILEANLDSATQLLADKPVVRYHDYRQMYELEKLDAVIVSLPNFLHLESGLAAFEHGLHVFMEKPLCCTEADCEQLVAEAQKRKLVLQTGFILRYYESFRQTAQLLREATTGRPMLCQLKIFRPNFPHRWRYDQTLSGGAVNEKCCHYFDLFNWWFGAFPVAVIAVGGQAVIKNGENYKVYCPPGADFVVSNSSIVDHALISLLYPNGAKANIASCLFVNWEAYKNSHLEIETVTDKGCRLLSGHDNVTVYGRNSTPEIFTGKDGKDEPDREQLLAFFHRIAAGVNQPTAPELNGLWSTRIAARAEESIRQNGAIQYF